MKTFLRFIFSKLFFKQLLLAIVIAGLLLLATMIGLRIYTHHRHTIQVPDLRGYNEAQVVRLIDKQELRYVIIDSVYTEDVDPGGVYEQIPIAGTFVKKNRKIFLVINAKTTEQVIMPALKNVSLRQAKVMLRQNGLKLGQIIYVNSEYKDLVIDQILNDSTIAPGTKVNKWSKISLEVGRGLSQGTTYVPYLRGLYYIDALDEINSSNLNEGTLFKDNTITEDTNLDSTWIWKQYPQPDVKTNMGKSIDLWLTADTAVVYAADTTLHSIVHTDTIKEIIDTIAVTEDE